ncbi:uncharacterized protein LOC134674170 [Cydia fagiglandana]|uniref:uncharacterized protein LOC134674170 n=1 Tax=Cydia fagiglandana TaxID=1458189 RepID=UPI002FEE6531
MPREIVCDKAEAVYVKTEHIEVCVEVEPGGVCVKTELGEACVKTEPGGVCVKMESREMCVKTEPREVYVKTEPREAGVKTEHREMCVKTEHREMCVKTESGEAGVKMEPKRVCVKTEPREMCLKTEQECTDSAGSRIVSAVAAQARLYTDHEVKDELVLGPEEWHRPQVFPLPVCSDDSAVHAREQLAMACFVVLERLRGDATVHSGVKLYDCEHCGLN